MVDYSKWDKMKFSSSEDEIEEEDIHNEEEDIHKQLENMGIRMGTYGDSQIDELKRVTSDKSSWWSSLSEKKRYEWFVDCYRMRVDDDYQLGGGNLHGLYNQDPFDGQKLTVLKDFLIFMKLAVKNEVIPKSESFSFGECLKEAASLLQYAFEKSDATEKWGGENVFSTCPSLRRTAEFVYGSNCMSDECDAIYRSVEEEVEKGVTNKFKNSDKKLFGEVGGFDLWFKLYRGLKL